MIIPIENTPVTYEWGSRSAIADLLGREPSGQPEAELWLGAHPASPSRVTGSHKTLVDLAPKLPFLMKLLAADAPLSIQAHPNPRQASEGYDRERRSRVPAAERNYRDPNAKPEIIIALSDPLRALCGFRPTRDVREELRRWSDRPGVTELIDKLRSDLDLPSVVAWLLSPDLEVADLVASLTAIAEAGTPGPTWETVRYLVRHRAKDPGIAVSVLLNSVVLNPGEALDVPAGRVHAYLHGTGIELMGSSDNVLRGGLTSKRVDVAELVRVLDFTPAVPTPLRATSPQPGLRRFEPSAGGFVLNVIEAAAATLDLPGEAIALSLDQSAIVGDVTVLAGEAVFLSAERRIHVHAAGRLFVAHSVPAPGGPVADMAD